MRHSCRVGFAHRPPGPEGRVGGQSPPYTGSLGAVRSIIFNLTILTLVPIIQVSLPKAFSEKRLQQTAARIGFYRLFKCHDITLCQQNTYIAVLNCADYSSVMT
jgi:hypothetical protein